MDKEKLKRVRIVNGMTQDEMAKFIGVSVNTYINWEIGVNGPSDLNEYRIEQAFKALREK